MQDGEFLELGPSLIGELDECASAIVGVRSPYEQFVVDRTADQFAGRVKPHLKRLGDVRGRGRSPCGFRSPDHQEELMLRRCEAVITRRLLGEGHEPTHPPPKVGERPILGVGEAIGRPTSRHGVHRRRRRAGVAHR